MSTRTATASARPRPSALAQAGQTIKGHWAGLDARERRLIGLAASVVGLALLWWIALAPAVTTLRQAATQRQELESQALQMQALQTEAETLKALPKLSGDQATAALEAVVKQRLGASAQMNLVGDRANLSLKDVPADALAEFLAEARSNARAVPVEMRLTRSPGAAPGTPARWNGALSLGLPLS